MAILFHGVRYLVFMIEEAMVSKPSNKVTEQSPLLSNRKSSDDDVEANCCDEGIVSPPDQTRVSTAFSTAAGKFPRNKLLLLRLMHAIFSSMNYFVALILMLIAMTYNPGLLLALVFGYAIGDFLFFTKIKMEVNECH